MDTEKNLIVSATSFFNYSILIYFKTNNFHIKIRSPPQDILVANCHLQRATPIFKAKRIMIQLVVLTLWRWKTHKGVAQRALWISQMTHLGVPNSVSKFGGILFTPIWNTAVFWYAAGPLKVRVSLCSQNGSPPPSKTLKKPCFICRYIATVQFY